MSEKPFLIWETPERCDYYWDKRAWYVYSPRAGGYYAIDANVADDHNVIRREPNLARQSLIDNKVNLSRWIYEENLRLPRTVYDKDRDLLPFIDEKAISRIEQQRIPSVPDRIDALLQYLEYKTEGRIAMRVRLPGEEQAMAATSSSSYEELEYLAYEAERKNWLNGVIDTLNVDASITLKGHMRLEELRNKQVLSEQAFVAMWFNEEMNPVWEQGFKPGIEDAGYKPMRIDQKQHINKIDDEIIAEIRRSRFLVADFTAEPEKPRGGVYYEAGFAHGLNIPVIFTCRADRIKELHFDTRQFNHIAWKEEDPGDLRKQLKNRISATLGDGPLLRQSQAAAKSQSGN